MAGSNCDDTCTSHGATNEATAASNAIAEGDCTVIDHFDTSLGLGLGSESSNNPFWHFGYFYTYGSTKWCVKYGSSGIGAKVGESNTNIDRRPVCACTGNKR